MDRIINTDLKKDFEPDLNVLKFGDLIKLQLLRDNVEKARLLVKSNDDYHQLTEYTTIYDRRIVNILSNNRI